MQKQWMTVNVSVATLWTTPSSPESVDQPALQSPADIRGWLSMTIEDRHTLYDKDKDQTQVLFGTNVEVVEVNRDWAYIVVADQPSIKDKRGYPGWVPLCQLSPITDDFAQTPDQIAVVTAKTAFLYLSAGTKDFEISYLTKLPVLEENDQWVTIVTPLGTRLLRKEDVTVYPGAIPEGNGQGIVEQAKRFLGLPYLWGGTSAFGYDCSGFAHSMHRANGIKTPRDASNQARAGQEIAPDQLLPGDLVFFAFEEGKGRVHHVGIYIGDGQMIHAPNTGKTIEIISIKGSAYEVEHCISRRYW